MLLVFGYMPNHDHDEDRGDDCRRGESYDSKRWVFAAESESDAATRIATTIFGLGGAMDEFAWWVFADMKLKPGAQIDAYKVNAPGDQERGDRLAALAEAELTKRYAARAAERESARIAEERWVKEDYAQRERERATNTEQRERAELAELARLRAKYPNSPHLCRGCGAPLLPENRSMADGCACNVARGINHGLVARNTCTCPVCDPAQTGASRCR